MRQSLFSNLVLIIIFLVAGCSSNDDRSDLKELKENYRGKIEFFQGKPEVVGFFDNMISEFEKENPDIDVEQVNVPDSINVLKTRIARGDVPDIFITYPIEQDYIRRVQNGYLMDLTYASFVQDVQPEIQRRYVLNNRIYGVALSQNAAGIIYNKKIFKKLGLEPPRTWSEFLHVMETIKKHGVQPLLIPNKSAISVLALDLIANEFDAYYWDGVKEGKVNISGDKRWIEIAQKMLQMLDYTEERSFKVEEIDATRDFVNGEAAMYVSGTWALPDLEKLNSNFSYGMFPIPATDDLERNKVLGGVDVGLVISSQTPYPEEAKKFIAFLLKRENAQKFSNYEGSISAVKGVQMEKEEVKLLDKYVKEGKSVNWPNHYWVGGSAAREDFEKYSHLLLMNYDISAYLKNLDAMFQTYRNE